MEIVISGMGVVSVAGHTLGDFWHNLESGKNLYCKLNNLNEGYRYHVASCIQDESWKDNLSEKSKLLGRAAQYVISAIKSALDDTGRKDDILSNARIALCIGTTMGEVDAEEKYSESITNGNDQEIYSSYCRQYSPNIIGESVCRELGGNIVYYVIPAACASGNYAISVGERLLKQNYADVVIACGVDIFSRVAFTGFQRLLSMSPDICKPFDKYRKGMILGEGCGAIVMEKAENLDTCNKVYGKIIGTSIYAEAYHMVAPCPTGEGAYYAMQEAINNAGILVEDINYISAHGTGTKANDKIEAQAINRLFGVDKGPATSSIKSVLGHSMGAASMFECIATLLMIEKQTILPNCNVEEIDDSVRFDCVLKKRKGQITYALSNAFGFGGQIGCIVISR